jgi:CTP synthase (UTP-ammonia lyase)
VNPQRNLVEIIELKDHRGSWACSSPEFKSKPTSPTALCRLRESRHQAQRPSPREAEKPQESEEVSM